MLNILLVCQIVTLIVVVVLLLRRQQMQAQDPRLAQLPDQLTRLDARNQALDEHIRNAFSQMRNEIAAEAQRSREASETAFRELRGEITKNIAELSNLLQTGLSGFRSDNKTSDDLLRKAVLDQMQALSQRVSSFTSETNLQHTNLREVIKCEAERADEQQHGSAKPASHRR